MRRPGPFCLALGVLAMPALGAPPSLTSTAGLALEAWERPESFPVAALSSLARTPDGLLWIGSHEGLVRFDGLSFEPVALAGERPRPRVLQLAVHPVDGALWALDERGVLHRVHEGLDRDLALGDERGVRLVAGTDALWVVASGRLHRIGETPQPLDGAGEGLSQAATDVDGTPCTLGAEELRCGRRRVSLPESLSENSILWRDGAGHPILLDPGGPAEWRLEDHTLVPATVGEGRLSVTVPAGPSRWTLRGRDLLADGARVARFEDDVVALLPDGDRVWAATARPALYRLAPAAVSVAQHAEDGSAPVTRLWWDPATATAWALSPEVGWWRVEDPSERRIPPADVREPTLAVPLPTAEGVGWRGPEDTVGARGERLDPPLAERSEAYAALLDGQASTWLGLHERLWRRAGGSWREVRGASGALERVRDVLLLDDGVAWIAAANGTVRLDPDALAAETIAGWKAPARQLRADDAFVWVATEGDGLCAVALDAASRRCFDAAHGLGRSTVHASLADSLGRTWISTDRGLGVVPTEALRAFARGLRDDVPALWLDERDGLATRELNGFMGSGALATPDGRLFFATQDGVAVVDPARFPTPSPPPVTIDPHPPDGVVRWWTPVDGHAADVQSRWRLDAGEWTVPSKERALSTHDLPPGEHRLEVQARLGGEWGSTESMQVEGPAGARGVGATVGVLAALATAAGATALAVRRRQAARPESRGYEPEEPTLAASPPPVPTLGPSLAASSPSVPTAEPTPVPTPAPPTPLIPAAGVLRAQLEAVADPRLADATFGAEELARAMATSRRTLHRRMMAAGLEAPSQWLQERRLLAGRRLLRERRCTTVGEAAAAVGLSRTWFADAYSERFGHPPSEELRGPPS